MVQERDLKKGWWCPGDGGFSWAAEWSCLQVGSWHGLEPWGLWTPAWLTWKGQMWIPSCRVLCLLNKLPCLLGVLPNKSCFSAVTIATTSTTIITTVTAITTTIHAGLDLSKAAC